MADTEIDKHQDGYLCAMTRAVKFLILKMRKESLVKVWNCLPGVDSLSKGLLRNSDNESLPVGGGAFLRQARAV